MKIRNSKGQFVKQNTFIQDRVSLSNDFKGLEIHQDKPTKPVNVVLIVAIMSAIALVTVLVIELAKTGGF